MPKFDHNFLNIKCCSKFDEILLNIKCCSKLLHNLLNIIFVTIVYIIS